MIILSADKSKNVVTQSPVITESEFSWMDVARQTISDSISWESAAMIGAGVAATALTGGLAAPVLLGALATQTAATVAINGALNVGLEALDPTLVGVNSVQTETEKVRSLGGQASLTPHDVLNPVPEAVNMVRLTAKAIKIGKSIL